ncbi:MAG: hypothetical protein WCY75_06980 [Sulfurimonadaceae bacterium]
MKRIISLLFILVSFVSAAATQATQTQQTQIDMQKKYLVETQPKTKGFACPLLKDTYFARIKDVNFWDSSLTCYVFDGISGVLLDQIKYTNPENIESLKSLKLNFEKEVENSIQDNKVGNNLISNLNSLEKNFKRDYLTDYYLNLPTFLIAGLTIDPTIIDIKNSIYKNKVEINSPYTLYSNLFKSDETLNQPTSNSFTQRELEKQLENTSIVSTTKEMISNSILLIFHFFEESNDSILRLKTYLFITVLPFAFLFLGQQMVTKKISGVRNHTDYAEKALLTVVSLFLFYFSVGKIEINSEDKINQVAYHNMFRPILFEANDIANDVAFSAMNSFLKYKMTDLNYVSNDTLKQLLVQKKMLQNENQFYMDNLTKECIEKYDLNAVKLSLNINSKINMPFPTSESQIKNGNYVNPYTQFENPEKRSAVSLSGCGIMWKKMKEKEQQIKDIDSQIVLIQKSQSDTQTAKKLEILARSQFQNFAELGWMAMPLLASTNFALKEVDAIENYATKVNVKAISQDRFNARNEMNENEDTTQIDLEILNNLPYLFVPFATTIKSELKEFISVPYFDKFIPQLTAGARSIFTILIVKFFIGLLPAVVIFSGSLLSIGFWLISVMIYYLIAPFLIGFALTTNQTSILKKYLRFGLILAFKPLMIVVSIIIAMFAVEFLMNLNNFMITFNIQDVRAMFSSFDTSYTMFKMVMIFMNIVGSLIIAMMAFYLVFKGADLIIGMLGIKDINFDVQNSFGDAIENKTNRGI